MQEITTDKIISFVSSIMFIIEIIVIVQKCLSLKQILALSVMLITLDAFICKNISLLVIHMANKKVYKLFSIVPFANLVNFNTLNSYENITVKRKIISFLIQNFVLSLIWGFELPKLINKPSLKKSVAIVTIVLFVVDFTIQFLCYFGYSLDSTFDTGCFILVIIGSIIGWNIRDAASSKSITNARK